jgi:hypothetical protein
VRQIALWVVVFLILLGVTAGVGVGLLGIEEILLIIVLMGMIGLLAFRIADEGDRSWLPLTVIAAFAFKLVGSGLRYFTLTVVYSGVGDATGYYSRAIQYNDVWREFRIPDFAIGSAGTTFTSKAAALVFTPYEPTQLGGFFLFATVAFVGQILFYLAFRRALPRDRARWYAIALFFIPSVVFWPSSIGKDSLMLLFIGIVAWGAAHILSRYRLRWLIVIALGLVGAGAIRLHVAALFGAALAAAILLGTAPKVKAAQTRRLALMIASGVAVVLLVSLASSSLGVDVSGDDLDPFLSELERRTQQGGSAVEGEAVRSIADVPAAALRTLYRPLLNETVNVQTTLSAVEGTALLIVSLLALPSIIRNLIRVRRHPYLIFCLVSVVGFMVGFSAIFNLGILARQRVQVLPLLLAILIVMGKGPIPDGPADSDDSSAVPSGSTPVGLS